MKAVIRPIALFNAVDALTCCMYVFNALVACVLLVECSWFFSVCSICHSYVAMLIGAGWDAPWRGSERERGKGVRGLEPSATLR